MLKTYTRIFLSILLFSQSAFSQLTNTIVKPPFPALPHKELGGNLCGTDLLLNNLRVSANYLKAEEIMNRQIAEAIRLLDDDSILLPVVFHILADDPFAIPDQVILDGLEDLNNAFAKRGVWSKSKGVDTKIRFCLAKKDPSGGNTTGITRVETYWGNHVNPPLEDEKMKATAQWDPSRYINIWFVRSIEQETIADFSCGKWIRAGMAGYATMPPAGGALDGIVVTGFGQLLAHEMGHYLGLYHTWEGFCTNNNCLLNGDRVCDTQPDGSYRASSCSNPDNTCNTDTLSNHSNGNFTIDVPDPIDNIMDYGDPSCQFTFTQGQADRMLNAINTQRSGLLEAKCEPPCSDTVLAGFKRSIIHPVQGDKIEFTNTSTGASTFQWFVDGAQVSTDQNFTHTFNQRGRFRVTLKAFKDSNCFGSFTENVIVNCGVVARFYTNKLRIASEKIIYQDTILFTNNSYNATDFKWLVSHDKGMPEQLVSTSRDLNYIFDEPANYTFRLIASKGLCEDTTLFYRVAVEDPRADGQGIFNVVHCYQQTKIKVDFYICNFGYDTIPANTPISFYNADPRLAGGKKIGETFYMPNMLLGKCCGTVYSQIIDVGAPGLNELWMVFNDSGKAIPIQLPNTSTIERNYTNNISVSKNFQMRATPIPSSVIMEPGDTFRLSAAAGPTAVSSYVWSPPIRLSCTNCQSPNYIADTTRTITKRVIATSIYSCYDTAYITITVPPYHDFRIQIDSAECAGADSIRIGFTVFNDFKRSLLPKGLTIRFYNGDPRTGAATLLPPSFIFKDTINAGSANFITQIKGMPNGSLYAVVNDSTGSPPVILPNTWLEEKNYLNNFSLYNYQRLNVVTTPLVALIEPGDTILLEANAGPGIIKSYTWSPAYNLTCAVCQTPALIADTTTTKRVIAENMYGCRDTAFLLVNIPPSDDFIPEVNEAICAANDSMYVRFTASNHFRRGILPKGLTIRFYDADPRLTGANELLPPFILAANYFVQSNSFSTFIRQSHSGKLFVSINDSGIAKPLVFPGSKRLEKDYSNNVIQVDYSPETLKLSPSDTTITRGASFPVHILNTLDNASSTRWQSGTGYSLSCTSCISPVVSATQFSVISVETLNRFGCILKGLLNVRILPPDFTISINQTECINNQTTRVRFAICMNNGYDSVWKNIPVTFYDGNPAQSTSKIRQTVFLTQVVQQGACFNYEHTINSPQANALFAVVNDKGSAATPGIDTAFEETNTANNLAEAIGFKRFAVSILPGDTTIDRASSITLITIADGGSLQSVRWTANPFLSCTDCLNPVVHPTYTDRYYVTGQNENQCTDTAMAIVRTVTTGDLYIPDAFTPTNDRLNDIFYIMGSEGVDILNDFMIYTRWGDKVFEAHNIPPNDPVFGWNGMNKGTKATPGIYVYQVLATLKDGKTIVRKGTVTLIR